MSRSARRLYANSTQIPFRRYLYRSHTSAETAVAPAVVAAAAAAAAAAAVAVPVPALAAVDFVAAAAAVVSPVPPRAPGIACSSPRWLNQHPREDNYIAIVYT